MIEVTIKDTDTNTERHFQITTESLKKDRFTTTAFFHHVDQMIGEFLRDLREQWKEDKP